MTKFAGVDACKGGWLLIKSPTWPCTHLPFVSICSDFRSVLESTQDCSCTAVDMPIGLPSGAQIRGCDLEARKLLGKSRSSSVFLAPPKETLPARTPTEFQHLHKLARGKGAGLPVWGIVPKVKEVDEAITPQLQIRIIEFHPELAWRRLANRELDSKHSQAGISQRADILSPYVPELSRLLGWKRRIGKAANTDDMLDALVGLWVAHSKTTRLPIRDSESDSRGLRMEMWY